MASHDGASAAALRRQADISAGIDSNLQTMNGLLKKFIESQNNAIESQNKISNRLNSLTLVLTAATIAIGIGTAVLAIKA